MENVTELLSGVQNSKWFKNTEHAITTLAVIYALNSVRKKGLKKTLSGFLGFLLKSVPGGESAVNKEIQTEVEKAVSSMFPKSSDIPSIEEFPKEGKKADELLSIMKTLLQKDINPDNGKLWAYVYTNDDQDWQKVFRESFLLFMHENALNPMAFPSLRKFETEVIKMAANMLHGDSNTRGSMTTGGTESILLAIKTYRDRSKVLYGITDPEIIAAVTVHPAFEKAGHYFGVKVVHIPIKDNFTLDIDALRKAINKNTIAVVASAPNYVYGTVDPIEEIGQLLDREGWSGRVSFHVDACVGGFMLPWVSKLGYPVPKFDFSVPQVTSISADCHKYGFACKGNSIILFRNENLRRYQYFVYSEWPGGLYISPSMTGSRGGGNIANTWAVMNYLGESGYLKIFKEIMETTKYLEKEINKISHLHVIGKPHATILAFTSDDLNIFAIADVMEEKFGWKLERQNKPDCIHLTVMRSHTKTKETFISNMKDSVQIVVDNPQKQKEGSAAMYGMVAKIPLTEVVDNFLVTFLTKIYS